MKFQRFYCKFCGLFAMLFLLASCAPANIQPTAQPQSTDTAFPTATPVASATMTPSQTITPIPSPSRRATFTLAADLTNTVTSIPSLTRRPTSNATRTPTQTLFVAKILRIGGTQMTPTPIPFACTIVDSYPSEGQIFKPRTDFVAKWKVINSGANLWHKDDILFGFVGGKKMHNPSRVDKILDYTLYVGDHMDVQIHMRPPKEPGIYTETWGLRKTNKKDFFCLLTVTIEIVK